MSKLSPPSSLPLKTKQDRTPNQCNYNSQSNSLSISIAGCPNLLLTIPMNRSGTRLVSPMTTMRNKKAHEMTYSRPKYSPSRELEAKNKAVPNSTNIINICVFSVLARRERVISQI